MTNDPLGLPLSELRRRKSVKWSQYEPDVLPLWIAEMDVAPCALVQSVLREAVHSGDTGYAGNIVPRIGEALSSFTDKRWGWSFPHQHVSAFSDIGMAVRMFLRALVNPGDHVVVTPPVYQSFFLWFRTAGVQAREVPLLDVATGARMDFEGLERAFADGAKVMILCSPHNPLGVVHSRSDLTRLAALAEKYDVTVISDEIHAPLTYQQPQFVPYLTISEHSAQTAICVTSTSKGWNLAGLKSAFAITARTDLLSAEDMLEAYWGIGHLGLLAAEAVFADDLMWINSVIASIEDRATHLENLLSKHLPDVGYRRPDASYLAWLDMRPYGLGERPADFFVRHARVALNDGPDFGMGGDGHVRLNFGTSREVLELALSAMGEAVNNR